MKTKKRNTAQTDFTYDNLPHNRFEVFKRLVTKRFSALMIGGLFTFLFFIPLIGYNVFINLLMRSVYSNSLDEEIFAQILSVSFLRSVVSIPCFSIAGLGIGCLIHYCQKLVWDEVVFSSDYFENLKGNWLKYLLAGFLLGITFGIFTFLLEFLGRFSDTLISIFCSLLGVAQLLFFSTLILQYLLQNEIYKNKFWNVIVNSFKFTFIGFLPLTLINLFIIYPVFAIFLNSMIVDILSIILIIFNFSPSFIVLVLYSNSLFDKAINLDFYPQIYDKGVYRKF